MFLPAVLTNFPLLSLYFLFTLFHLPNWKYLYGFFLPMWILPIPQNAITLSSSFRKSSWKKKKKAQGELFFEYLKANIALLIF